MERVTGTRRLTLTAGLFAAALVLLVGAIFSHSPVPLFAMWVPLLAVPLVLGRADPSEQQAQGREPAEEAPSSER